MTAEAALMRHASCATFLKRLLQSLPRRVKILTAVGQMDLDAVTVELDFVNPSFA